MKVVVLSDRAISANRVSVSALIVCGGVHHHLVQHKSRFKVVLMVETGEAREVHHFGVWRRCHLTLSCDGSNSQDWPESL